MRRIAADDLALSVAAMERNPGNQGVAEKLRSGSAGEQRREPAPEAGRAARGAMPPLMPPLFVSGGGGVSAMRQKMRQAVQVSATCDPLAWHGFADFPADFMPNCARRRKKIRTV